MPVLVGSGWPLLRAARSYFFPAFKFVQKRNTGGVSGSGPTGTAGTPIGLLLVLTKAS